MLEQRASLIEAADGLKKGMFVHLHGYVNEHGEKQNVTVHADASYENTHKRSSEMLDVIAADIGFQIEIERNFYKDAAGVEYTRKAKDRNLMTQKEIVKADDPDLTEAIEKVRKGIIDPRKIDTGFKKVSNSVYEREDNDKTYFRNVLVASKQIVIPGEYPVSCSARVNVIADAIRKTLPIGQYRTYVLDDKMVTMPDGSKQPRFEYVAMMSDHVSSSSSSVSSED
jgi:hypothetical protein